MPRKRSATGAETPSHHPWWYFQQLPAAPSCCQQPYSPRMGIYWQTRSLPALETPGILHLQKCAGICCRRDGRSGGRCDARVSGGNTARVQPLSGKRPQGSLCGGKKKAPPQQPGLSHSPLHPHQKRHGSAATALINRAAAELEGSPCKIDAPLRETTEGCQSIR